MTCKPFHRQGELFLVSDAESSLAEMQAAKMNRPGIFPGDLSFYRWLDYYHFRSNVDCSTAAVATVAATIARRSDDHVITLDQRKRGGAFYRARRKNIQRRVKSFRLGVAL